MWSSFLYELLHTLRRDGPHYHSCLTLSEGLGIPLHVRCETTVIAQELDVRAIKPQVSCLPFLHVLLTVQRSETPFLADNDLLPPWELVLTPP